MHKFFKIFLILVVVTGCSNSDSKKIDIIDVFINVKYLLEKHNLVFNNKMIFLELSLLALNNCIFYLNVKKDLKFLTNNLLDEVINSILEL